MQLQVGKISQMMPNSRGDDSVDLAFDDGSIWVGYKGKIFDDAGNEVAASVKDYIDQKNSQLEQENLTTMLAVAEVYELLMGV
ncbi:MAG: hypothetical protein GX483_09035 [Actinomycetaceae bacterium]|nr:hypothetical protein [Actinomycetaceae bacterium]